MDIPSIIVVSWWLIIPLIALGSALHFVYDWSGHHRAAAVFGAVNESYWEHVKIAVWPVAIAQVVLFALGGWQHAAFVPAATVALYTIPVAMIGLVYLYKHLLGRNVLWLDIAIFALVIAVAQVVFTELLAGLRATPLTIGIAALFLAGLVASFLRFTLRPPAEPDVFVDPLTREYGLRGHDGGATS